MGLLRDLIRAHALAVARFSVIGAVGTYLSRIAHGFARAKSCMAIWHERLPGHQRYKTRICPFNGD